MIIRVDKCKTFGYQKEGATTVQFLPKLLTTNSVIPPVKINEQLTYLGRHFNFQMDDEEHKSTLWEDAAKYSLMLAIYPCTEKHKIELYSKYLWPKISGDLTVVDLGMPWVKQNLDDISSSYLRKWLEIPINETLDIITLSKKIWFGLDKNVYEVHAMPKYPPKLLKEVFKSWRKIFTSSNGWNKYSIWHPGKLKRRNKSS